MDGKKYKKTHHKKKPKLRINELDRKKKYDEQAATLENTHKPLRTFKKISSYSKVWKNKQNKNMLKPVMLAVISALVIGSLFGIIMLRMFVTMDATPEVTGNTNPAVIGTDEAEEEKESDPQQAENTVEFASLTAYVLQAGVFSERKNAEAWSENFKAAGIPVVIWEREGQYYLFAGVANSAEAAAQAAEELETEELELYSKEWKTKSLEISLTANEEAWLNAYLEWWNQALGSSATDQLNQLIDSFPDDTNLLHPLYEKLTDIQEEGTIDDKKLLELWQRYETLNESR